MNIAYIRVSTTEQNTDRQHIALQEAGIKIERVYEEKLSGKDLERPQLKAMLDFIREGDTLYIESISRLARSLQDLLAIVEKLKDKKVNLVSLKENIKTDTAEGILIFNIFGALIQFERECMAQRQREGIETAKAAGKHIGRPRIPMPKDFTVAYNNWKAGNATAAATWRKLRLTKSIYYKLVKEYESKHQKEE